MYIVDIMIGRNNANTWPYKGVVPNLYSRPSLNITIWAQTRRGSNADFDVKRRANYRREMCWPIRSSIEANNLLKHKRFNRNWSCCSCRFKHLTQWTYFYFTDKGLDE